MSKKSLLQLRFGLRTKLLLLSSFLFVIPWFGYQYVWEMEKYLRFGQEQTLVGTARALATALHERENLFNKQASFLPSVEQGKDLYGYQLTEAIQLDGLHNDWPNFSERAHFYDHQQQLFAQKPLSLNFKASVGKYDKYLYLFFQMVDNQVIFRGNNSRSITSNDHLALSFSDQNNQLNRFIISNKKPGWISAYRITDNNNDIPTPAPHIQGHWLVTPQGYNIELRVPLKNLGDKIAFAFYDVDQPNGDAVSAIGSAEPNNLDSLGTILVPSPEIERIVKGMRYTNSSIWVVDQHHRVLASAGSLKSASGVWHNKEKQPNEHEKSSLWYQFKQRFLLPLYYKVLTKPPTDFIDKLYDARHLNGEHIVSALTGNAKSQWRLTTDKQALVLSAAYPIYINNKVQGAVIVEETTNGIRTLRNRALERLFTVILTVMVLGALTFIIFATRITSRIRHLSNQAENAIDKQGRIIGKMSPSKSNDEIGDLSRSFTTAVNRLSEYNHYLENMSSRLSHELRTPIAVVKTSLENLAIQAQQHLSLAEPSDKNAYIDRAQAGINTLNLILTNMSEATRLEQMLIHTEKLEFDLKTVVDGCIAGYEQVYPDLTFNLNTKLSQLNFYGSPEHIVQLLDKVINNAVEFSQDRIITIALTQQGNYIELAISNNGTLLPEQLSESLFDSMVSMRDKSKQEQPHLGLGLYIARLICQFHHGSIQAQNHYSPDGVTIKITLPAR
ncbi:MAG: proteobacterial dedicated sortase system histidine kinase [Colwellia sp.]|nr:proteobacterial dedicated sortase system histidine kinase [Colwellia sp.]MCW9081438.1 proteobacterial dedicated sortase system histidine kinase [Colwellia sp.]